MACAPDASVEVVKAVTPLTIVPVPRGVVPSMKITVPVGVPIVEVTVAVNVIGLCARMGLTEVVSVMLGAPLLTTMLCCTAVAAA